MEGAEGFVLKNVDAQYTKHEDYVFGAGPDFTMNLEDFGFDTVYGQDVMECVMNRMFPWYRAHLNGTTLIVKSLDKTHQPSAEIITSGLS